MGTLIIFFLFSVNLEDLSSYFLFVKKFCYKLDCSKWLQLHLISFYLV